MEQGRAEFSHARLIELMAQNYHYALGACGFGALVAWVWIMLSNGYPVFTDGVVDLPTVVLLFAGFVVGTLLIMLVRGLRRALRAKALLMGTGAVAGVCCLALAAVHLWLADGLPTRAVHALDMAGMGFVGLGASFLFAYFGLFFSRFKAASSLICLAGSSMAAFAAYFLCMSFAAASLVLFAFLPLFAAASLLPSLASVADRAQPGAEATGLPKGYRQFTTAFVVYFFAIGVIMGMEPVGDFSDSSDVAMAALMLIALAAVLFLVFRKMGAVLIIKRLYTFSTIALVVCCACSPLSLDLISGLLFKADCLVLPLLLWMLVTYVASNNVVDNVKAYGLALALGAAGLIVGYLAGIAVYALVGHDRYFVSIALACATTIYCTIGFSAKNFPYLRVRTEQERERDGRQGPDEPPAAPVAAVDPFEDAAAKMAEDHGLTRREQEMLVYLLKGYDANFIAEDTTISYHTARTHIRNIYAKLDVHSRNELISLSEQYGRARDAR